MLPVLQDSAPSQDDYKAALERRKFKEAHRILEGLLKVSPHDHRLLEEMIMLCVDDLKDFQLAKPWVLKRIAIASLWYDYALLATIETFEGNAEKARRHLNTAERLEKKIGGIFYRDMPIRADGYFTISKQGRTHFLNVTRKLIESRKRMAPPKQAPQPPPRQKTQATPEKNSASPAVAPEKKPTQAPCAISIKQASHDPQRDAQIFEKSANLKECLLLIDYARLNARREFEDLLCLPEISGVEHYWYQIETVKKVLKYFHGRVLLGDEVGLGKTIEAGMLIKEYLLRNMVKNVLILTPSSLVSQWKEEMDQKFKIPFVTAQEMRQEDSGSFWDNRFIIASFHTAKKEKHFQNVTNRFYDLVVVDEAHHLKNRRTLFWKLVNEIKKRFIVLATATPVQNNLVELFNLITLLKPGQFSTEKAFKSEYVRRGGDRTPANQAKLRELLRDCMIRNTRSAIDLKLPRRFACTVRLEPTAAEREIHERITQYVKRPGAPLTATLMRLILRETESTPSALKRTLLGMERRDDPEFAPILQAIDRVQETAKGKALLEIFSKNLQEKKVVFTQYRASMDYLASLLTRHNIPFAQFQGDMTAREKDIAIARFREETPVLLSTESGGEGRNLQFCNTIVNFDLPWNPMQIEQRIGRLHRIGQTRDVFVFNLAVRDTVEDYVLQILESKINMFEMVIGEIEPILGHLEVERDFDDVVIDLWLSASNAEETRKNFSDFGDRLIKAKAEYLKSQELDKALFGENYEA